MKTASYDYILKTVSRTNILPVTSACTMGCIFCSHKNNPQNINVYSLPRLSFEEITDIAQFLDGRNKIVIGESASRIIEGEPFLRDDIIEIVKYIRKKYRQAEIGITTNGVFLTEERVKELKTLEPIEMNISLNSSTIRGRNMLYSLNDNMGAIKCIEYLDKYGISFNGSIVAMPDMVGCSDIEETIAFLCLNGARTVRVFVPGFSVLSHFQVDFFEIRRKLHIIADAMYEKYGVPVLIEPPEIKNLEPEICGVIKGSPAFKSGILKGDIVMKIDDYAPLTRVDAYNALRRRENPKVQLKRGNVTIDMRIEKKRDVSAGTVFYYDIHPGVIDDIANAVNRNNSKKPLIITSELAFPLMKLYRKKFLGDMDILSVKNRWFGGSIMCTGLLTVGDIANGLIDWCNNKYKPDLIILPSAPFDADGKDLSGRSFDEIEDLLGIKTAVIP